jgi:FAD/FMN-containing dehydrogenase
MQHLSASDAQMRVAQLRVLGGEMARVPADETAFAHRSSRILANIAAFYDGPHNFAEREAWVTGLVDALQQDDHGAYVNFLVDEGPERVHDAYPGETYARLARIKARYDPDNLFRLNQNVPPRDA